ncbi:MAG: UDP-N-acetylglucosamine 2-epimerase (non-hydrolyzing) [bacterium]|nr:MAG: UDP-N-acetylglucosamine 2-epimerase (non-hydrolyzing) [bacterium]
MEIQKRKKFTVLNVIGARPNFMKIAPIHRIMKTSEKIDPILVHTGQHYDDIMSKIFFVDLGLPEPDVYLGVGSGTHAQQTGAIMVELEKIVLDLKPNLVLVVGDVNSTMAAALVASKLHIPIAHVEAGLRSFDRSMPEEINRKVTDALADFLFITEVSGRKNLLREGIPAEKIYFVGNVMIDSLMSHLKQAQKSNIVARLNLDHQSYALLTLHRPSNVDDRVTFNNILNSLEQIQKQIPIIYPIHPRSRKMLDQFQFASRIKKMTNFKLTDPLGYFDFLRLMENAKFVLSDSGGIQEETTVLGIPCLTLRKNTERPITVELGTNVVVGTDTEKIVAESFKILSGQSKKGGIPPLWDGNAARRIVDILEHGL